MARCERFLIVAPWSPAAPTALAGHARIIDVGAIHTIELAAWGRIIQVNLTGMFLACKYALREFLENGGGSIVTVGSVAATVGRHGGSAVRANCVCPGSVQTDLNTNSNIATAAFDRSRWFPAPIPGRADPNEIAGAIAFLASDDASFITGATLMVDGGFTAM